MRGARWDLLLLVGMVVRSVLLVLLGLLGLLVVVDSSRSRFTKVLEGVDEPFRREHMRRSYNRVQEQGTRQSVYSISLW